MKKGIAIGMAAAAVLLATIPFALKHLHRKPLPALPNDHKVDAVADGADTQYVRTDGGYENANFSITVIHSKQELTAYYEQYKTVFDLEHREDGDGFLDACAVYDDAYFADRILVLAALQEGSGSIYHNVTRVALTSAGALEIDVTATVPYMMTMDMAQWHLFIQPTGGVDVDSADAVKINRTYRYLGRESVVMTKRTG